MPAWGEFLVLLVCLVGIIGTVLPVLPGDSLVGAAVLVWALVERTVPAWITLALVVALLVAGHVLTVLPTWVLLVGGITGIVGFFVVPVVGLPLGFVLGVFVAEFARTRLIATAWPATVEAMKGTGLSVLISLTTAVIATVIWGVVAVTT